jgi:hypothetical protein
VEILTANAVPIYPAGEKVVVSNTNTPWRSTYLTNVFDDSFDELPRPLSQDNHGMKAFPDSSSIPAAGTSVV